jgi:uncharacterized membrane protein SpoIIM required for sporulation
MASDRFISDRKGAWQRLEELLAALDRTSLRRLGREEVRELGRIYRRTSSDLAIARAESRDPRLVNYLNSLVIRAHGRIYRAEAREGGRRLRNFFLRDFPATFRQTWRHTLLSFLFFLAFFAAGFLATWRDADFADAVGISYEMRDTINSRTRWWEELNRANQVGGALITTNNVQVTFTAFALGALLGVGTLYVLALNGLHIGTVLALTYRAGFGHELVAFMSGHGVIELTCIFIAGAAGLLIGGAILAPGDLSRFDALRLRGRQAVHLIVGCVPLLFIAGAIEGFISPAPIHPAYKFSVAILTGVALYLYLLLSGREAPDQNTVS